VLSVYCLVQVASLGLYPTGPVTSASALPARIPTGVYILTTFTYNLGWVNALVYARQVYLFKRRMAETGKSSGNDSSKTSVAGKDSTFQRDQSTLSISDGQGMEAASSKIPDPAAFVNILRTSTQDPDPDA
jgi:hypothetical protein